MPLFEPSMLTGYLVSKGLDLAWNKATRNRKILQVLRQLGLRSRRPPSTDFDTLYVYSLVEFGIGRPKALIELFADQRMEEAFRKAFGDGNRLPMYAAADEIYESIDAGADLQRTGCDPRHEFERFVHIFEQFVNEARTAVEIRQDRKLDALHDDFQSLQSHLEPPRDLPGEIQQIARGVVSTPNIDASVLKEFCRLRTDQTISELSGAVLGNGPYLRDVYVERQRPHEAFSAWLMGNTPCFAIVGRSGMGKTSLLCALAEQSRESDFVLFYRAKLLAVGLAHAIGEDIAWDSTINLSSAEFLQELDIAAGVLGRSAIILLDGLDEFPGDHRVLAGELAQLAQHFQGRHIKLCVSCKDTDWSRFAHDDYERPSALARLTEHASSSTEHGVSTALARSDEVGLQLESFSDSELEGAFEKYRDVFKLQGNLSGATREACRTPLLLGLVAEIYSGTGDLIPATLSKQQLLDTFWDRRLSTVRHRDAAEQILNQLATLCMDTKQRRVERHQFVSTFPNWTAPIDAAFEDLLRFGWLQTTKDELGYGWLSFSVDAMRLYTYTIKAQKWPLLTYEELAPRLCALLSSPASADAVEFYLTTIYRGEADPGVIGLLTEVALHDFASFVAICRDLDLRCSVGKHSDESKQSEALLRRLEQYAQCYDRVLSAYFGSFWTKVDPFADLRVHLRRAEYGGVGIWVSKAGYQLRARSAQHPEPLIVISQDIVQRLFQSQPPLDLIEQIQGGGPIQIGFPDIGDMLPEKLSWKRLQQQIASAFNSRMLDESQSPTLLAERVREELLYEPSGWVQGCQEASKRKLYYQQIGADTVDALWKIPIADLIEGLNTLLRTYAQQQEQAANPACWRWYDFEIKRQLRLIFALDLLRHHYDRLPSPQFTLDELYEYSQQHTLASAVRIVEDLLPEIFTSYDTLLETNLPTLKERFMLTRRAEYDVLVELAGRLRSSFLSVTYALLPRGSLPTSTMVYARMADEPLSQVMTTHQTLRGYSETSSALAHFGRARISCNTDTVHLTDVPAFLYSTRWPSHYPVLDQCYQLLGTEAEDMFGGLASEWMRLENGNATNPEYTRWIITNLARP